MQAASRRYPTVHYWMIWGEPNGPNFNPMPPNSPVGPQALRAAAGRGLRRAEGGQQVEHRDRRHDLDARVRFSPPDFIRWMRLPNGAAPASRLLRPQPLLDALSQPRKARPSEISENLRPLASASEEGQISALEGPRHRRHRQSCTSELAAAYKHRRGGAPKLWLSEFSISSDSPNCAFEYFVSRPAQALWVTAAFKLVDSVSYVAGPRLV